MSIELKIKSKHLGLEAKVIKHEEHKLKKQIRWSCDHQQFGIDALTNKYQSIHNHRVWDVRNENRATFLARAYLAGVPYHVLENKRHDDVVFNVYILPRVFEMVNKYGPAKDRITKRWNSKFNRYEYSDNEYKEKMGLLKEWAKLV